MTKQDKRFLVFRKIDMRNGDISQCWPWKGPFTSTGRPSFSCNGRTLTPYIVVYELVYGDDWLERYREEHNVSGRIVLRHTCDNGMKPIGCCNFHHLIPGSHAANMRDMKERERHGLPHHAVKAIKRLLTRGEETHQQIADKFGVSRETVTAINNGRVYTHVENSDVDDA